MIRARNIDTLPVILAIDSAVFILGVLGVFGCAIRQTIPLADSQSLAWATQVPASASSYEYFRYGFESCQEDDARRQVHERLMNAHPRTWACSEHCEAQYGRYEVYCFVSFDSSDPRYLTNVLPRVLYWDPVRWDEEGDLDSALEAIWDRAQPGESKSLIERGSGTCNFANLLHTLETIEHSRRPDVNIPYDEVDPCPYALSWDLGDGAHQVVLAPRYVGTKRKSTGIDVADEFVDKVNKALSYLQNENWDDDPPAWYIIGKPTQGGSQ